MRKIFSPWVILAAVLLAGLLLAGTLAAITSTRPISAPLPPATAILTVIPAPSPTFPATTPTSPFSLTPTPASSPTPIPGTIAIDAFIQISGTGGDGLRLRAGPGLDEPVRYLALEAEVFQVKDGPSQANDFTWWYLVAPFDESRNGWAVAPYLVVIQNP